MHKNFVSTSIWFLAAMALIFAMITVALDAGAQSLDDPTPTPTEVYTCWFDETGGWICIGSVPTEPTATATPVVAPPVASVYLPIVKREPFLTPRAETVGQP